MRAYSPDLRHKIVDAVRRGLTKTEVARTFSVSRSSVKRYVKIDKELDSLVPSKPIGSAPKIDDTAKRLLESDLEERPAATLAQRRAYLLEITGLRVSISTLWRALKRLGYSHKKRSVGAAERDEFQRTAWKVMVADPFGGVASTLVAALRCQEPRRGWGNELRPRRQVAHGYGVGVLDGTVVLVADRDPAPVLPTSAEVVQQPAAEGQGGSLRSYCYRGHGSTTA